MAGSSAWKRLKSLLRKDDAPLFLNDTSAFDFSDEVGDEGLSRFNKLRVVVADDGSEIPERPINGAHPALQADDDSLLDQDLPLANSQLSLKVDPCDNCSRQRELLKQRKVKTRLTIAAVLYLLFMIGELVGELWCQLTLPLPCPEGCRQALVTHDLRFKLSFQEICYLSRYRSHDMKSTHGSKVQINPSTT